MANGVKDLVVPAGYRLVPELKSERIHVSVQPSLKEKIKRKAAGQHISVNEYINRLLEKD